MNLSVLISCMHQKDWGIVERTNVQTDCVVINQCDCDKVEVFTFFNKMGHVCQVKFISTTERGLSRSRNMAIKNAVSDICLLCDDDEVLEDNYNETILNAFTKKPEIDIFAFRLNYSRKVFSDACYRVRRFASARVSSTQVAFRRDRILKTDILFDEKMGSGSGNGAGEENKFLFQLISCGMKMMYEPFLIATIKDGDSMWFHGYTDKYFIDKGWCCRRIFGSVYGYAYLWYHFVRHYDIYAKQFSATHILWSLHKGFFEKRY
ncbi:MULTISPECIES: glycosyltransferase family A protein [Butyricimonas]|uniref:glycosyltransferase family A protein n=1 Tax=Butyricimonas TaxID=574697 RepID=UPI001D076FEF|nr:MULTISPECIES: glycosyltransferase family A protein [Butyricimonas]MCB6974207.1 glycosyltransferase family 2 protein [Butyricimonas synergistica]MCG4520996.1 glycosyltransferase family 2 protein [Butyricimonas sp. DFI.6.44]